eukprot:TRINITY_DN17091_c0_g1_i2.p1 TRINITY_DN17091_c0_g1~~TRINITY_DN17091_c0_g1_i2.p1  ORF type:complete len:1087 (+),score=131.56 TRINITY_DN17091_c0_g1_i2:111-3371(+)
MGCVFTVEQDATLGLLRRDFGLECTAADAAASRDEQPGMLSATMQMVSNAPCHAVDAAFGADSREKSRIARHCHFSSLEMIHLWAIWKVTVIVPLLDQLYPMPPVAATEGAASPNGAAADRGQAMGSQELLWNFFVGAATNMQGLEVDLHMAGWICSRLEETERLSFAVAVHLLSTLTRSSVYEQLTWLFSLVDSDVNGWLSGEEVGLLVDICELKLHEEDDTPAKEEARRRRVQEQLMAVLDAREVGRVYYEEFILNMDFVAKQLRVVDNSHKQPVLKGDLRSPAGGRSPVSSPKWFSTVAKQVDVEKEPSPGQKSRNNSLDPHLPAERSGGLLTMYTSGCTSPGGVVSLASLLDSSVCESSMVPSVSAGGSAVQPALSADVNTSGDAPMIALPPAVIAKSGWMDASLSATTPSTPDPSSPPGQSIRVPQNGPSFNAFRSALAQGRRRRQGDTQGSPADADIPEILDSSVRNFCLALKGRSQQRGSVLTGTDTAPRAPLTDSEQPLGTIGIDAAGPLDAVQRPSVVLPIALQGCGIGLDCVQESSFRPRGPLGRAPSFRGGGRSHSIRRGSFRADGGRRASRAPGARQASFRQPAGARRAPSFRTARLSTATGGGDALCADFGAPNATPQAPAVSSEFVLDAPAPSLLLGLPLRLPVADHALGLADGGATASEAVQPFDWSPTEHAIELSCRAEPPPLHSLPDRSTRGSVFDFDRYTPSPRQGSPQGPPHFDLDAIVGGAIVHAPRGSVASAIGQHRGSVMARGPRRRQQRNEGQSTIGDAARRGSVAGSRRGTTASVHSGGRRHRMSTRGSIASRFSAAGPRGSVSSIASSSMSSATPRSPRGRRRGPKQGVTPSGFRRPLDHSDARGSRGSLVELGALECSGPGSDRASGSGMSVTEELLVLERSLGTRGGSIPRLQGVGRCGSIPRIGGGSFGAASSSPRGPSFSPRGPSTSPRGPSTSPRGPSTSPRRASRASGGSLRGNSPRTQRLRPRSPPPVGLHCSGLDDDTPRQPTEPASAFAEAEPALGSVPEQPGGLGHSSAARRGRRPPGVPPRAPHPPPVQLDHDADDFRQGTVPMTAAAAA